MAQKKIWIYGVHSAFAALANPNRVIYEARCIPSMKDKILKIRSDLRISIIDNELLLRLTRGVHQGIALCCDPIHVEKKLTNEMLEPYSRVLILDHLQDVNNLGGVMRSMVAMKFDFLITCQRGMPDLEQAAIKSASGAIEHLKICQVVNVREAVKRLKQQDYWCIGLDHTGRPLSSKVHSAKIALVIGSEGEGIKEVVKKECDELASLKTNPEFPVLNASVAAAISMYIISIGNI